MELIDQLYKEVTNRNYKTLKTYHPDWILGTLTNMCIADKKEPTLENMLKRAGQLESDLYLMFHS